MFGLDFNKIAELIPQVEATAEKIGARVAAIEAEQKAQSIVLNSIDHKLNLVLEKLERQQ